MTKQTEQYKVNADIKLDVYKLQKDIAQMERECDAIKRELIGIRNEVEKIKDDIVVIRADIKPFGKFIYALIGIIASGLGAALLAFILSGNLA